MTTAVRSLPRTVTYSISLALTLLCATWASGMQGTAYKQGQVFTVLESGMPSTPCLDGDIAMLRSPATVWQCVGSDWTQRGQKGDTGATGATGPQGPQGIPGTSGILSSTTASIGGAQLISIGACSTGNVTVAGASVGMHADATPSTYPGNQFYWSAYVSSANTVTVRVCTTLALLTPGSSVYNVRVIP